MSLLIETGASLYGCVSVLHGEDLAHCSHRHLENAIEAATGLPPSLQRLFFKNKKVLMTSSLSKQGLALGDRLFLHIPVQGGMPHTQTPVLEEHYSDNYAERCGVVDNISECVFSDPVMLKESGQTYSRSTIVQNGMRDPVLRGQLTDADLIPNRSKAAEADQYLDRRLKADISKLEKSNLRDRDNCTKLLSLVAMVVRRSNLTACLNAKRLLVELLSTQPTSGLHNVVTVATAEMFQDLVALARDRNCELLEAQLLSVQQLGDADLPAAGTLVTKSAESVSVKVNKVHPTVTKEQLEAVFRKYGTITSSNIIDSDGKPLTFAYVNYSQPDEAKRAVEMMNGEVLGGSKLHCSLKKMPGASSSSKTTSVTVKVFPIKVSHLTEGTTDADLKEKFSEFGKIASVELKTQHRFAFINFYDQAAQRDASSRRRLKLNQHDVAIVAKDERTMVLRSEEL